VVVSGPAHSPALLTIYSANHSGYSEDFTVRVPYQTQRWSRLRIALEHGVGVKQLRLDPLIGPGLVDIATVSLRSQTTGAVLWRANRSGGLEELSVSGTALHLPHQSLLRLLSYGDDPQVYLPDLTGKIFDEPLTLQVLLRFDPAPTNIERAVSGWNDLVAAEAEIKELRSALAFTTAEFDKSRGELRSQITETAARSKETERIQLELEARTSRFEQVSSELALLRNQLGVEHRAKVRMAEEFTRLGKELRSLKQHLDERKRRFPRKLFATKDKEKGDLGPKLKGNTSECRFWLDFPTGPTLASENVVFSGWVLPPPGEKILGVRALVQGEEVVGQYGFERSDVAAAFSDRPEGLYPGFSVAMPLSVGSHEVALQVLIGTAKWVTFYLHRHEVLAHPSREG